VSQFDDFAGDYESALAQNLRFIPGGVHYYYKNRVRIAADQFRGHPPPRRILDFGAGIGLTIPLLRAAFPSASISICDTSAESTTEAKRRYPFVEVLNGEALPEHSFDLIVVAGVIHHIAPSDRDHVVAGISRSLASNGTLIIYELNPLNPVTRRLVRCCPFDEDAALITKRKLKELLAGHYELRIQKEAFMVFLPPLFARLAGFERLLSWCPLGAQYFLVLCPTRHPS
jgi:ubiquinone/menaquinone biosynthesis C-methylase UbiE